MSGNSGFLFKFLSKVGGPRVQTTIQKFAEGRELHRARQEAWDFAHRNYETAMKSNDKELIRKTLEAAEFGAGSTLDSLTFSRVAIGNLAGKLEKLEAKPIHHLTKDRSKPTNKT